MKRRIKNKEQRITLLSNVLLANGASVNALAFALDWTAGEGHFEHMM